MGVLNGVLNEVLSNQELFRRGSRVADHGAENRVLLQLVETLNSRPADVLQELVDGALELCNAESAGLSLLEDEEHSAEGGLFRWVAVAGALNPLLGHTLPRRFSPCGSVLDANQALLMTEPARYFGYISELPVPVSEVLLVPFYRDGAAIGTIWVVAHSSGHRFDREDLRAVSALGQFATMALRVVATAFDGERRRAVAVQSLRSAQLEVAGLMKHNAQLVAGDQNKADFLATLTHELRNSLAPLDAALRVIRDSTDRGVRNRAREMLERQVTQMKRLVDDLLDTSRISSGKLSLIFATVDLNEVVRNAVEAARSRIETTGQTLSLDIVQDRLFISADEDRLAQVLGNLLTNAAKYGRPGGTVRVTVRSEAPHAIVCVQDDGVGIDPSMLSKIFELFVQADTPGSSPGGLGIGLALVRRLIELHGGSVSARSEGKGLGSAFTLRIPLSA